jgi:hypothetical protein
MANSEYVEALNRGLVAARTANDDRTVRQLHEELRHLTAEGTRAEQDAPDGADGDDEASAEPQRRKSDAVPARPPATTIHPPSWLRRRA